MFRARSAEPAVIRSVVSSQAELPPELCFRARPGIRSLSLSSHPKKAIASAARARSARRVGQEVLEYVVSEGLPVRKSSLGRQKPDR